MAVEAPRISATDTDARSRSTAIELGFFCRSGLERSNASFDELAGFAFPKTVVELSHLLKDLR
jgi:hypothetical protein